MRIKTSEIDPQKVKYRLKSREFRAWLKNHPNLTFKGSSNCQCPIAAYLNRFYPLGADIFGTGIGWRVWGDTAHRFVDGNKETRNLPKWAKAFIRVFDERYRCYEGISPQSALEKLNEVLPET